MSILSQIYKKYGKEAVTSSEDVLDIIVPDRRKNQISKIILIGGSEKYRGAIIISGLAALRNGMHGALLIAPEKVCAIANNSLTAGFITLAIDEGAEKLSEEIREIIKKWDTRILIGPGIDKNEKTLNRVLELMKFILTQNIPMVVDANAIEIMIETKLIHKLKNKKIVMTPNDKEFIMLCGSLNLKVPKDFFERIQLSVKIAKKLGIVLCVKGRRDIITDGKNLKITYAGEPVMSTAGCGDVLAGLITSFMAETDDLFKAATAGTFISGRAGDIAFSKKGYSFVAQDLLDGIIEFSKMAATQTTIDEISLSKYTFKEKDFEI